MKSLPIPSCGSVVFDSAPLVIAAAGTFPTTSALGILPPRQVIPLVKGWLDLKSGKFNTGWSLIDREVRLEGSTVGPWHHGSKRQSIFMSLAFRPAKRHIVCNTCGMFGMASGTRRT